jgi:hypothetical protein
MIPKIIHYCWFSTEQQPLLIRNCIKSWKKVMPDYEIKCWNKNSFDFDSVLFVRQAIEKRKWAFAADYVRLYALYTEGGIYLDSDVEVFKRFDDFLNNSFFAGTECNSTGYSIEAAIMGSEKGHKYIYKCMEYYQSQNFILPNGELNYTVMPVVLSDLLKSFGYQKKNQLQRLENNITIYPTTFFITGQFSLPNIYAWHKCYNSWVPQEYHRRGKLYKFFKRNDLMSLYRLLETIIHKFIKR